MRLPFYLMRGDCNTRWSCQQTRIAEKKSRCGVYRQSGALNREGHGSWCVDPVKSLLFVPPKVITAQVAGYSTELTSMACSVVTSAGMDAG